MKRLVRLDVDRVGCLDLAARRIVQRDLQIHFTMTAALVVQRQ
jgi:hypothetical protein